MERAKANTFTFTYTVDGEHMEINRGNFWSVACKRLRPRTETFELNIQQLRYEWDVIN